MHLLYLPKKDFRGVVNTKKRGFEKLSFSTHGAQCQSYNHGFIHSGVMFAYSQYQPSFSLSRTVYKQKVTIVKLYTSLLSLINDPVLS